MVFYANKIEQLYKQHRTIKNLIHNNEQGKKLTLPPAQKYDKSKAPFFLPYLFLNPKTKITKSDKEFIFIILFFIPFLLTQRRLTQRREIVPKDQTTWSYEKT
jgi:hypothetical protein